MKKQQKFLIDKCKLCCDEKDRYGDCFRKFVTHAANPEKIICTNCGFTKLNKTGGKKQNEEKL